MSSSTQLAIHDDAASPGSCGALHYVLGISIMRPASLAAWTSARILSRNSMGTVIVSAVGPVPSTSSTKTLTTMSSDSPNATTSLAPVPPGPRSSHLHELERLDGLEVGGCRREVRVTELELDVANARALAEELCSHHVTQRVWVDAALEPRPGRQALQHRPDVGGLEGDAPKRTEERSAATQADDRSSMGCPLVDEGEGLRVEPDRSVARLAGRDAESSSRGIEVGGPECQRLSDPEPRAPEDDGLRDIPDSTEVQRSPPTSTP